jgi:phosphoglycerate dehydrogenase-like enzyme
MTEPRIGKYRVLVLDDYEGLAGAVPVAEQLKARADVTIMRDRLQDSEELRRTFREVHVLLAVRERTRLGEKELSLAPELKLISQTGGGIAHLDLKAATQRGIAVAVTGSDLPTSTVELTLGLILAVLRKIALVDRKMREQAWPSLPGRLLRGKTVGIIGLGRIGKEVARLCQAFRASIIATGKTLTDERAREVGAARVSLDSLLQDSDIVTIHARFNEETRGLIGKRELSLMKPGAILINTSRGPIVSEPALLGALETGQLGGIGLDVYDLEPLPFEHPLRRFENAVLLSHRGYASVEGLQERFEHAMNNILSFIDGRPTNLLNPEVLSRKE